MTAGRKLGQRLGAGAELIIRIREIDALADDADREAAHAPALADARVEPRRLATRVGPDDQQRVGVLDPGNRRVEQIGRAAPSRIERAAVLARVDVLHAEPLHQHFQREYFLDRRKIAGDSAGDLAAIEEIFALKML